MRLALVFHQHQPAGNFPSVFQEVTERAYAPLVATLLADLVRRNLPDVSISAFSFRALKPLFDTGPFLIGGHEDSPGAIKLWAKTTDGGVVFTAEASLFQ